MIGGISRAGGRLFEAQERLVFAGKHGLYVGEDLVAELGTVHMSAESGQFIAASAPARNECLACHGRGRIVWVTPCQTSAHWSVRTGGRPSVILYSSIAGDVLSQAPRCNARGLSSSRS